MKFTYEDMSDDQFERLIVFLCQRLLGISVQGFAKGPDGGRDAKFIGTAELHPSKAAPWVGTTIIQAKHTNGYNRSFSETDFFSPSSAATVLGAEIPRIKRLRESKQIDHYMLFANRRLSGNAESDMRAHLASHCDIPCSSIYLCGVEQLDVWLKRFPGVAIDADLDPVDSPLIVSSDELAEIVQALARNWDGMERVPDHPPAERVTYKAKNTLNNMSADYAKAQRGKYLKEAEQIRAFLAAPENDELMKMYASASDEFQLAIIAKRKYHQSFDEVMEYLVRLLFDRDAVLRQRAHKRLTRAVLFYMYWNCDIGKIGDDPANETLSS